MKKRSLAFVLSFLLTAHCSLLTAFAEEGIWIPMLLQQVNLPQMQSMGLKLTADDIYSINHSSLKDAIVMFGRGCTGVIVSGEGLLLTNHHCGFGSIQSLSSLEHDYLTDGFWAMKRGDELPAKGLTVTLLVRMEEVTGQALKGVTAGMNEQERAAAIKANVASIESEAAKGTPYEARVRPFFYGNQYYLFITEVFKDVRLVGAPPSSVGKFGGDTDNWMWPRHTGDFSVFRIYAGKDNLPADYSPDNVPYKPAYSIPVSIGGYNKGDFTFVFGYPGTTREYIPARGVEITALKENPVRIKLRQERLDIIGAAMDTNRLIALQYANKQAGIANYWKKMIGETRGIKRLDGVNVKTEFEKEFTQWVNEQRTTNNEQRTTNNEQRTSNNEQRTTNYLGLLPTFSKTYDQMEPLSMANIYLTEAALAPEIVRLAGSFEDLVTISQKKGVTSEELSKETTKRKNGARDFYKNYNKVVDEAIMKAMLPEMQANMSTGMQPSVFAEIDKKFGGNTTLYATDLYKRSLFSDSSKIFAFLSGYKAADVKKILKDPGFLYARSVNERLSKTITPRMQPIQSRLDSLQRIYMAAQMEMRKEQRFYPDANSTLRVSYGKVDDYSPADGVTYNYYTTTDGILAKEDLGAYDYVVDPKLKELLVKKNFGRYADVDGSLHVAFTASNHTTGGNSGSPVLNAEGQLLGLNFDRNWEGTMSDLMYDPSQCRNITLDIRYCLFIMDVYAGAGHLVQEMTVVGR
jgi:hypothetical protein